MDNKTKAFLKKVFDLGSFHAKSNKENQKMVLKNIYKDFEILNSSISIETLEKYLQSNLTFTNYCVTNNLNVNKMKYKLEKTANMLKHHKLTKDILIGHRPVISELSPGAIFFLEAIDVYKKSLKKNRPK